MRHIFLSALLTLAIGMMWQIEAVAQDSSTPTPQTLGSIITEQESAILKGFFDKLSEAAQGGAETDTGPTIGDIVTDVIKTVSTESSGEDDKGEDADDDAREEDDDEDESAKDDDADDDNGEGKGKGKKKDKGKGKGKDKKAKKDKGRGSGLPPGLQRQLSERGSLPPGLQNKLRDTGALPPGLQASALPEELEAELPELPEGQQRVIIDNDVLVIEEVTGQVLDAIPDIIPPELAPILNELPTILQQQ